MGTEYRPTYPGVQMLNDLRIRQLKPSDRMFRVSDGQGLSLQVETTGKKKWRFRYRYGGKEKMIGLGSYPQTSLAEARAKRLEAASCLDRGENPSDMRRAAKREVALAGANTFGVIAAEYLDKRIAEDIAVRTIKKQKTLLTALLPDLANRPVAEITPPELLEVLRRAERRGKHTLANEARALAGRIFRYAIATQRADRDIAADLQGALLVPKRGGHSAITEPKALGKLLETIEGYHGDPLVKNGLLLLAHTFVRPGELREALWKEVDFDKSLWRIPAERTKLRRDHLVPLSRQSSALLNQMWRDRGNDTLIMASRIRKNKAVSDMAFNSALRRLGMPGNIHVAHGFRKTASTLLNEQGYNRDWIERQMAHVEGNNVRRAYNAAEYLPDRTRMMQDWSDYLEGLADAKSCSID